MFAAESPTIPYPSGTARPELVVVIPVYNERASIRKVVTEWCQEIEGWTEQFQILVINDGSTDGTPEILEGLRDRIGPRLEIVTQANAGHGQACMHGYRLACEQGATYVLQIDSDGQCDPQYFFKFWRMRESYDVIYGVRKSRDDGWKRILASWVLRGFILAFEGTWCADANVPYRLMRCRVLEPVAKRFPSSFHLANIGLTVVLKKISGVRHGYVAIGFRERYGGEPHVAMAKFGVKALELKRDLRSLRSLNDGL